MTSVTVYTPKKGYTDTVACGYMVARAGPWRDRTKIDWKQLK